MGRCEILGLSRQQRRVHPDFDRHQQRTQDLRDYQRARRRSESDGPAEKFAVHAGQTDEFTALKDEWKKITAPLEKEKEKPLRFLRYFMMANYKIKNQRSDAVVREDEIYDWLTD